jgi:hypothetical protein
MPLPPMVIGKDGRPIGARILRLGIWREVLEIDWCRYLRLSDRGVSGVSPPMLTSNAQRRVFFTDLPSISACFDAVSLAERLTLAEIDRFRREGALLICFPLFGLDVRLHEIDGVEQPLTDGGARQWVVPRNVPFSVESMLFEVLPRPQDNEGAPAVDDPQEDWLHTGWRYANPKLSTEEYRDAVLFGRRSSGELVPNDREELERVFRSATGDDLS